VEPSTSGDSSCSSDISAGNDNNLNGINDNNVDQDFPLNGRLQHDLLHPMNGRTIDFNPLLPPQPVENRLQWVSSTTWQISNPSHPNPLHPSVPTPNVLSLQQPSNPILSPSVMQPNLGSPSQGPLAQNGISNHPSLPTPAGIFGGHHTVGHISRGAKQSRLTAPLPPSNDIPFSQLKRGRKLGQVHDCVRT